MVKVVLVLAFLFCFIIDVPAQFNTIYRSNLQVEEAAKEKIEQTTDTIPEVMEKGFFKKGVFAKISSLFKAKRDSVPMDPNLFSYDKLEGNGFFIFTEQQEKEYLDSLKYELIKKRREVLVKRAMMSLPMDTLQVTSHYGYRTDPFTGQKKFHNGIDFRARNNYIYPILPGVVIRAGFRGGYGYCIEVKHGELVTLYAHLSYILVQENQIVPAGEPIGISGTTGRSTGEHLHFSVIQDGKFVNPSIVLEYILGELADRNVAKEEIRKEKLIMERDLEKEKEVLESLKATERPVIREENTGTIIYGGKNGKKGNSTLVNTKQACRRDSIISTSSKRTLFGGLRKDDGGHVPVTSGVVTDSLDKKHKDNVRKKVTVRSSSGTRIVFKETDPVLVKKMSKRQCGYPFVLKPILNYTPITE